jgi:branched-chain amino acid transport system substrate-binding protein
MKRRSLIATAGAALAASHLPKAYAATVVGVTKDEIKIGHTIPYSGPASAYGAIGKGHMAFFKRLNEQGGIAGRKINLISLDDGYLPPKTVEQVRRLVEQDQVAFLFNTLGTPNNSAIQKYVNQKKVPHIFLSTGADKWGDPEHFPWTIGWQPSYRTEAQIYAKYILKTNPNAKIGVIYQNDDFGKDYVVGLKDALGANYSKYVVKELTYEVTDATIDSQAVSLQAAGADTLVTAATPKFAAQMIRKVADMEWKPAHFLTNVSSSVGAVITPAGPERAIGIITSAYGKDPTDPTWAQDAGMNEWRAFMKQYLPEADTTDGGYTFSYGVCTTLVQVLRQCGDDFSRENVMKQATSLKNLYIPTLLPGITVNTSATNYHPIRQMQLSKWNGKTWQLFGDIIEGTGA